MANELPETRESLWSLAASPAIWAAHFLACYTTAAIWCAKFAGPEGSLAPARAAIGAFTLISLAAIVAVGWRGWKRHRHGDSSLPHDFDSPEDRHRFLGFSSSLLSGLSAIAVVYQALPAVFIGSCR